MADISDILGIERGPSTEALKDSILGTSDKLKAKKNVTSNSSRPPKRPEGMARELYALLCVDGKDAPPLLPTDTGAYFQFIFYRDINYSSPIINSYEFIYVDKLTNIVVISIGVEGIFEVSKWPILISEYF